MPVQVHVTPNDLSPRQRRRGIAGSGDIHAIQIEAEPAHGID